MEVMLFLHVALVSILLVISESTASGQYSGTFPTSGTNVIIHARLWFVPQTIKAEQVFTYTNAACSASNETRVCQVTKADFSTGYVEFEFHAPNTLNLPKLELRGKYSAYILVVFREPLKDTTEDFTVSPLRSAPLAHFAATNDRSVEVKCAVKVPKGSTTANLTISVNGELECSVQESDLRTCKSVPDADAEALAVFYTVERTKPLSKVGYHITCTADGPSGQSYLSKYVEFPQRGGSYTGRYGNTVDKTIWFKTWFTPAQVKANVAYNCSVGKCKTNGSETTYTITKDALKEVWNFYFVSDPRTTGNWVSVHGEKAEEVVVAVRWTHGWNKVPDYSFEPSNFAEFGYFPFERTEEVLIHCPLKLPDTGKRPSVVLYDNGLAKCGYGKTNYPECARSTSEPLVIEYKVKSLDAPNDLARHILCASKDPNGAMFYLSHFVQFPEA